MSPCPAVETAGTTKESTTRPRHIPERSCVACRTVREKRDLVRVVRTPAGEIVLDPTGKANGRGAYLCRDWNCLRAALKRKGFERAFKGPLSPEAASALEAAFRGLVDSHDEPVTPGG